MRTNIIEAEMMSDMIMVVFLLYLSTKCPTRVAINIPGISAISVADAKTIFDPVLSARYQTMENCTIPLPKREINCPIHNGKVFLTQDDSLVVMKDIQSDDTCLKFTEEATVCPKKLYPNGTIPDEKIRLTFGFTEKRNPHETARI